MSAMDTQRFAIYFTFAPDHPLYQKASKWLGHCVYNQPTEATVTFSEEIEPFRSVQLAAQYGFHATLKPPFRLQSGTTQTELEKCVQDFSSSIQSFSCAPLKVDSIGNFLALVPGKPCDDLNELARQCVQQFDPFRAPLNAAELEKRLRSPLTPRQQGLLEQWGYPYVLDEFRFHMTLTDRLPDNRIVDALRQLTLEFAPLLAERLQLDRICLCHQEKPGDPFYLLHSYSLGGLQQPQALST